MTGSEFIPVAAKAVNAVGKAALSDADVKKELLELAKESPAMKSAADKYARRVAVKQGILLKLYQPLARALGIAREYFDDEFASDLAQKTGHIPDGRLVTPPPSVALPAMQGLSYSLEEPDLKEMYLNLLATATDGATSESAHPSFAEVIKQLSAAEAGHLLEVLRASPVPIVRLRRRAPEGQEGGRDVVRHLMDIRDLESGDPARLPSMEVWVDNWSRLGLVDVDHTRTLVDEGRYDWVTARPEYVEMVRGDQRGEASIEVQRGVLFATSFGRRFAAAVSPAEVPDSADERPESAPSLENAD